jgi:tetratricopeptide (TPR) repeat protein
LYYESRRDLDKAIHYLKVAINEEQNPTALFNLAVIYEEKGDRSEAKKAYHEVLKMEPKHYKSKVNLAIILEKEGKSAQAFDHY